MEKGYKTMQSHNNSMKNWLYQVNQELISYQTYKIDTLTEIIDTVMNFNNITTMLEREILNRIYIMTWEKFKIMQYQLCRTNNVLPTDYKWTTPKHLWGFGP